MVAHEHGALDAVAVLVVQIGSAAGQLFGAVILVPTQGIAVNVKVVGIPSVFPVLRTVFVLEITTLVKRNRVHTHQPAASVAATVDVISVFNHIDSISVNAHLLTR